MQAVEWHFDLLFSSFTRFSLPVYVLILSRTRFSPLLNCGSLAVYSLFARLYLPRQLVFWGNPISSGHIDSSDFFMSADIMEVPTGQLHYTEQMIRIDGQGIWYVVSTVFLTVTYGALCSIDRVLH